MVEVVLEGDINGKADCRRKRDPSSNAVTTHGMTAEFVCVICVSVLVRVHAQLVCVCRGTSGEEAQPSPAACVISIITVDTANCYTSEIKNV